MRRRSATSYTVIRHVANSINPVSENELIKVAAISDCWLNDSGINYADIKQVLGQLPYNKLKAKIRSIMVVYNDTSREVHKVKTTIINKQRFYYI